MNAILTTAPATAETKTTEVRVDLLSGTGAAIFAAAAPAMVANGWSVFPQETTGERRMPGKLHGRTIRWSEEHDLANTPPTADFLRDCGLQCAGLNVACVFGPASGNTFAVDVDVMDERMAEDIVGIAEEHLGPTPFVRVGRAPKMAMIYRHAEGDVVRSVSRRFAGDDGQPSEHGLEILGAGKLLTFHGRHHKTGNYFQWLHANPISDGPGLAPEVTAEQVQAFLKAVDARFPFAVGASSGRAFTGGDAGAVRVARLARPEGSPKLSDGREEYVRELCWWSAMENVLAIAAAREAGDGALDKLVADLTAAAAEEFRANAVTDGRWTPATLAREIGARMEAAVRKLAEDRGDTPLAELVRRAEVRAEIVERKEAEKEKAVAAKALAEEKARVTAEQPLPFTALGYSKAKGRTIYHFMGRGGQVLSFRAADLGTVGALLELADLDHWQTEYPGRRGALDVQRAAADLVTVCTDLGVYSPDRLRGRGLCFDAGRTVLHLGNKLVVDGVEMDPRSLDSRFIYEVSQPMEITVGEPLTAAEGGRFVELCQTLAWKENAEGTGSLFAGWLMTAAVCGGLDWRAHAWVSSEKGGGKSWVMKNLINPVLEAQALKVKGKTSEAAIRRALGLDARPVLFDEFEGQNQRDRERVQQVLDLARAASEEDDTAILKAESSGDGVMSFKIRSAFVFQSIALNLGQAADESRCVVFELRQPSDKAARDVGFARCAALHLEVITPDFAGRFLARALATLPVLRTACRVFKAALVRQGREERTGDTMGTAIAGAWVLTHDAAPTAAEAEAFVREHGWDRAAEEKEVVPEWRRALDLLIQQRITMVGTSAQEGREEFQVGRIVDVLAGWETSAWGEADLRRALGEYGIRVEGLRENAVVVIANRSAAVDAAFDKTQWAGNWTATVARATGATKTATAARFGALVSRGTAIPYAAFSA